jgi:hypothetical protein
VASQPLNRSAKGKLAKLEGIALKLGRWFSPQSDGFADGLRVMVAPTALDASIARIRAGKDPFAVTLNHGGHKLLTGDAGCFSIYRTGRTLWLRITGTSAFGKKALKFLSRWPSRELSAGFYPDQGEMRDGPPPTLIVTRGRLFEISIVASAACRGCRFLS